MWKIWNRHARVMAPEGESGGGAGAGAGSADPGAGGDAQAGAGAAPSGGAPGAGEGQKPAGQSSILDFAAKGQAPAGDKQGQGGDWKAPDGIPDHLKGGNAEETINKLLTAYNGARKTLAQKGQGDGGKEEGVPETPEGYEIKADGDDDKIAAELNSEASKPIVDSFRKAAHELGISAAKFEGLMKKGMAGLDPSLLVNDESAMQISAEKEMEALTKLAGDPVLASTIVNTVENYGKRQLDAGLFTQSELQEFRIMCGTAESAALFYKIMTGELGEKPIPLGDPGAGEVSATDAYALQAQALKMPPGSERDAALQRAQRAMEKAFGQQPTGAVRSNVL